MDTRYSSEDSKLLTLTQMTHYGIKWKSYMDSNIDCVRQCPTLILASLWFKKTSIKYLWLNRGVSILHRNSLSSKDLTNVCLTRPTRTIKRAPIYFLEYHFTYDQRGSFFIVFWSSLGLKAQCS